MSKSVIDAKYFHDEAAAYRWVEARVWPNGHVCPHCGGTEIAFKGIVGKRLKYRTAHH